MKSENPALNLYQKSNYNPIGSQNILKFNHPSLVLCHNNTSVVEL